jgi:copper transport protein
VTDKTKKLSKFRFKFGYLAVLVLAMSFLFGAAKPPLALAHAALVRSLPAAQCFELTAPDCQQNPVLPTPPTSIHLWFSESVQTVRHGIIVIAPSGKQVEFGLVQARGGELEIAMASTEEGTYQVLWQVISDDTHPVRGNFLFSVGKTSQTLSDRVNQTAPELGSVSGLGLVLQVIGRWLHFAGFALAFGGLMGRVWSGLSYQNIRLWWLINLGIGALLLSEPFALLGQTSSLQVGQIFDPDLIGDILSSSFGRVEGQHLGGAILLWVLTGFIRQGSPVAERVALGLGVLLALGDGQSSHAVTSGPLVVGLIANTIHLLAMGVWLGGLAVLVVCPGLPDRQMLIRFSRVALLCLGWLVISGLLMSGLHLSGFSDLFTTSYGRTLSIKVLIMFGAIGLAWVGLKSKTNRFWWKLELGGLCLVLIMAGLLISLPPPA